MGAPAVLIPLTPEAKASVGTDRIILHRFPFRMGRESRSAVVDGDADFRERRKGKGPPNNDLYMMDHGERLNISREHLQIEKSDDGQFFVFDRASACGTIVDGKKIGGHDKTGRAPLRDGSVIIMGSTGSPYKFSFKISQDG